MWDFKPEEAASSLVTFDSDATPMRFNGELAKGETEASTTRASIFVRVTIYNSMRFSGPRGSDSWFRLCAPAPNAETQTSISTSRIRSRTPRCLPECTITVRLDHPPGDATQEKNELPISLVVQRLTLGYDSPAPGWREGFAAFCIHGVDPNRLAANPTTRVRPAKVSMVRWLTVASKSHKSFSEVGGGEESCAG